MVKYKIIWSVFIKLKFKKNILEKNCDKENYFRWFFNCLVALVRMMKNDNFCAARNCSFEE
jgi:hypothetical protein